MRRRHGHRLRSPPAGGGDRLLPRRRPHAGRDRLLLRRRPAGKTSGDRSGHRLGDGRRPQRSPGRRPLFSGGDRSAVSTASGRRSRGEEDGGDEVADGVQLLGGVEDGRPGTALQVRTFTHDPFPFRTTQLIIDRDL